MEHPNAQAIEATKSNDPCKDGRSGRLGLSFARFSELPGSQLHQEERDQPMNPSVQREWRADDCDQCAAKRPAKKLPFGLEASKVLIRQMKPREPTFIRVQFRRESRHSFGFRLRYLLDRSRDSLGYRQFFRPRQRRFSQEMPDSRALEVKPFHG